MLAIAVGAVTLGFVVLLLFIHGALKIAAAQALMECEHDYQNWLRERDTLAVQSRALRNGKVKV